MDELDIFDKNEILEFELAYPCKKSTKITKLRMIGNKKGQYVTNVYYLDTLRFSYDECEIYSTYSDDNPVVYSCYHSDCEYCKSHKKKVRENLIVGYKIYPKGIFPNKSYKERKLYWQQFK